MIDDDYKQVHYHEVTNSSGKFGIRVDVCSSRDLGPDEINEIRDAADAILKDIQAKTRQLDPKTREQTENTRTALIGCFDDDIILNVEPIPNGYCSDWCCRHLPWYRVTTPSGVFVIGWRKRVISIDWTSSQITRRAVDLFPYEDVTREERIIHAWTYAKATEYIARLMSLVPKAGTPL